MRTHIIIFLLLISFACYLEDNDVIIQPPKHFPELIIPINNTLTEARVDLGKRLFFSKILSKDSTVSCASCHKPNLAFVDGLPVSEGIEGRKVERNAPSLFNVAYFTSFLRDGGVPTLEQQIAVPIQEHNEFDFNILLIAERMQRDSTWVLLSKLAYNRIPDPFVITRSIAAFERTFFSGSSPYDDFLNGNKNALSNSQQKGLELFNEHCESCHSGLFFTNEKLENNGLYVAYKDSGRMRVSLNPLDRDLFKTPSLRNVELTSPYMHDGILKTLEEVIEHYNLGGKNNPQKSKSIKPLNLSEEDKRALVDFLKSLTDRKAVDKYTKLLQEYQ